MEIAIETAHPPLLLHRKEVVDRLGLYSKLVHELWRDGDLRKFYPNPRTSFGYYYAVDLARMEGRRLPLGWMMSLPELLEPEAFQEHSGLAPRAFWTAIRCGTLKHQRGAHGVRVWSNELVRFV